MFLAVAGHPLRRRLLRELAESDRRVSELTTERTAVDLATRIPLLVQLLANNPVEVN